MVAAWRLLVLLALVAPLPAAADGQGASGLHLTATPGELHLAEGARSTLRIVGAAEPPVVAASVGRIDVLREVSSGVYEAEFVPPDSLDPQVAVITALSGGAFAWVPIPLSGIRELTVRAPNGTEASVSVESEVFGPVRADAMGRAQVRVLVPPGVRTAYYGRQPLDLGVPDVARVHVVLSSAEVDANQAVEVTARAFATTERGKPRAGAPVTMTVSAGVLSRPVEVEPGVFEARWRVEKGRVGSLVATARLRDLPAAVATATLERVPGPPRSITIEVDKQRLVAGEDDELAVTARVLDEAGNTTESPTTLMADPGVVLEWERTARGRWEGRVQVPRQRAGRQRLGLRVAASRTLSVTLDVPLLSGPPRQLRVESEEELRADGRPYELRIVALDRDGNRVELAEPPVVTVSRGQVDPVARHALGIYRLSYRSPLASEDFDTVLKARSGTLESETRLRVRTLGGGVVLAPKVGVAAGTGGLRSPVGGAEVAFWVRQAGLGLVLEGQVYALRRSDTIQGLDLTSEVTFVALTGALAWRRPVGGWLLWLGAGGGAVNAKGRVSGIPGQAAVTGSSWAPEAHASLGLGRPAGPGTPFGELRLGWQGEAKSGPARGSLEFLQLLVGYRFDVL